MYNVRCVALVTAGCHHVAVRTDTFDPFICRLAGASSEFQVRGHFVSPRVRFLALGYTWMVRGREAAVDVVEGEEECGFAGQEEDSGAGGREVAERSDPQV